MFEYSKLTTLTAAALIGMTTAAHASDTTSFVSKLVDLQGPCRFSVTIPSTAAVEIDDITHRSGEIVLAAPASSPDRPPLKITFTCTDAAVDYTQLAPVRYDFKALQWTPDLTQFNKMEGLNDAERRRLKRSFEFHRLTAGESKGFAYFEDSAVGEGAQRQRYFSYCLFRDPIAICNGSDPVGSRSAGQRDPKDDMTRLALRIVRSIRFEPDRADATAAVPARK